MKAVVIAVVAVALLSGSIPAGAGGVMILFITDRSGSMGAQMQTVASAESAQVKTAACQGDFVGRIVFDEKARADLRMEIRGPGDLEDSTAVLAAPLDAGSGWTLPSNGLAAGRALMLSRASGRPVLAFVVTDGIIAAASKKQLQAEVAALRMEVAKWKALPNARVFLVAIDRSNNEGAIRDLAAQLHAQVVTPKELASTKLVVRQVQKAREAQPKLNTSTAKQSGRKNHSLPLGIIASLLVAGFVVITKVRLRPEGMQRTNDSDATDGEPRPWVGSVTVRVTVDGESELTRIRLPETACADGRVAFGPTGAIQTPSDVEFDLIPGRQGSVVDLPAESCAIVDGIRHTGGQVAIGTSAEIMAGEAHILITFEGK